MTPSSDQNVSNSEGNATTAQSVGQNVQLPSDATILLPVRSTVLFPGLILPITIGRPKSIAAIQQAVREERHIGLVLQRNA